MRKRLWALVGADGLSPTSRRTLGIVAVLYFLEGAPPAILGEVLPVYFRVSGASLTAIGGLRLLELPYSLKFFWSPLVHRYGDRRAWMAYCLVAAASAIALMPFAGRPFCRFHVWQLYCWRFLDGSRASATTVGETKNNTEAANLTRRSNCRGFPFRGVGGGLMVGG